LTTIYYGESVWHYDPYDDLKRLFELSGFPVRKVDTIDVSEPGVFITSPMNGDFREHIDSQRGKPRNAHIILWQLERPSSEGAVGKYGEINRRLLYDRYVDEIWVSDRQLAVDTTLRYVTLGSRADFGAPSDEKVWDVVHMSYNNPRRQTIFKQFDQGRIGPNCWPPERDDVLARSRLAVNVHQDTFPYQEPLRFAIFAAYGLPILTETLVDAWPYGDDVMEFAPYDHLYVKAESLLKEDGRRLREMGLACRRRMTEEFEFGKVVRQAVQESVGDWR
jgi:hypothetical protein